jgi:hypothetical protein
MNIRALACAFVLGFLPACAQAETAVTVRVTLFGYADNDPPGTAIAHPRIHRGAAGQGTYNDPITFAANPEQFAPGTMIYVPYLQKYFVMEDDCATAIKTASYGAPLIDLWAGGTASSNYNQLMAAESAYTRDSAQIIVNPTADHPVKAAPIFADRSTPREQVATRELSRRGDSWRDRLLAGRWPWF